MILLGLLASLFRAKVMFFNRNSAVHGVGVGWVGKGREGREAGTGAWWGWLGGGGAVL